MVKLFLKKNEHKKVLNGFPWIYANEVQKIDGKGQNGEIAQVFDFDGNFVCLGFLNHLSKIIVRVLTLSNETINKQFFLERIRQSVQRRWDLGYENCFRAVFAESDLLPGLIVDKYSDVLSVQFLCLGMDKIKELIVECLVEIFNPKGIFERSDVPTRIKEGLTLKKGELFGEVPNEVWIKENGLNLCVDVKNGQKTGYFLDQKENRASLQKFVKNKSVLDCFCNVGGFSLCAKHYGAKKVTAVDVSPLAIETVQKNALKNNLQIETICADAFEQLRLFKKQGESFDVVILDPPAFTKTADKVQQALKGYKDINVQGLKLVKNDGYLITCSCSQHVSVDLFMRTIRQAVFESGKKAQMVELRTQACDHSSLLNTDESLYLKFAVLRILD